MKYNIKFTLGSKKMQMILETEYPLKGKIKVLELEEIETEEENPFNGDLLEFLKGFKK